MARQIGMAGVAPRLILPNLSERTKMLVVRERRSPADVLSAEIESWRGGVHSPVIASWRSARLALMYFSVETTVIFSVETTVQRRRFNSFRNALDLRDRVQVRIGDV